MNSRFLRNGIVTLVLVVGTAALLYMFIFPSNEKEPIPYSGPASFLELVEQGQVAKVTQRGQTLDIEKTTNDPQTGKPVARDEPRAERAGNRRPVRYQR